MKTKVPSNLTNFNRHNKQKEYPLLHVAVFPKTELLPLMIFFISFVLIKCQNKVQQINLKNSSPSHIIKDGIISSLNCKHITLPMTFGYLSSMMSMISQNSYRKIEINQRSIH